MGWVSYMLTRCKNGEKADFSDIGGVEGMNYWQITGKKPDPEGKWREDWARLQREMDKVRNKRE